MFGPSSLPLLNLLDLLVLPDPPGWPPHCEVPNSPAGLHAQVSPEDAPPCTLPLSYLQGASSSPAQFAAEELAHPPQNVCNRPLFTN